MSCAHVQIRVWVTISWLKLLVIKIAWHANNEHGIKGAFHVYRQSRGVGYINTPIKEADILVD